ncbi:MAG: hypothetical protein WC677_02515 [Clostridia bacterium]|jgi:hypothetical protein
MYSDKWLEKDFKCSKSIKVSKLVDYKIYSDSNGKELWVAISYNTADDFHYELLMPDWNRFLSKVLHDTNPENTIKLFRDYLANCESIFSFQYDLNSNNIKYEMCAFYDMDFE